jgi:hypothetical protein
MIKINVKIFGKGGRNMRKVIVYLLVAIAAFAGSYLLYEIMSRIPFIRWCVLGIKKEKKE